MATANADRLEPLGIGFGVLLVLVGLATIVGTPWAYKSGGILVMVGQSLGAVAAIAIGAGLVWLARR
ncbi:hypothetical protein [Halorussus salinisoli]|uniref:hypothetical protein n=1 Tax=Halorussus salinisoli TaxID=2558242 RepID=UPI0010C1F40C|nr:hypothetical protein [Halorussus salinisoli]